MTRAHYIALAIAMMLIVEPIGAVAQSRGRSSGSQPQSASSGRSSSGRSSSAQSSGARSSTAPRSQVSSAQRSSVQAHAPRSQAVRSHRAPSSAQSFKHSQQSTVRPSTPAYQQQRGPAASTNVKNWKQPSSFQAAQQQAYQSSSRAGRPVSSGSSVRYGSTNNAQQQMQGSMQMQPSAYQRCAQQNSINSKNSIATTRYGTHAQKQQAVEQVRSGQGFVRPGQPAGNSAIRPSNVNTSITLPSAVRPAPVASPLSATSPARNALQISQAKRNSVHGHNFGNHHSNQGQLSFALGLYPNGWRSVGGKKCGSHIGFSNCNIGCNGLLYNPIGYQTYFYGGFGPGSLFSWPYAAGFWPGSYWNNASWPNPYWSDTSWSANYAAQEYGTSDVYVQNYYEASAPVSGGAGVSASIIGNDAAQQPIILDGVDAAAHEGNLAFMAGRYEEAKSFYIHAMLMTQDQAYVSALLGMAASASGDISTASLAFRRSLAAENPVILLPTDMVHLYPDHNLGSQHLRKVSDAMLHNAKHPDVLLVAGYVHLALGHVQEAKRILTGLLEENPNDPAARVLMGSIE